MLGAGETDLRELTEEGSADSLDTVAQEVEDAIGPERVAEVISEAVRLPETLPEPMRARPCCRLPSRRAPTARSCSG